MRVLATILIGFVLYCAAAVPDPGRSAHDKLHVLQYGKPPSGTRITLSNAELQAWVVDEGPYWASYGATNLRFTLGAARATVSADIDFLKARKAATGQDAGWLLRNLFSGKKPVAVTVRFASRAGQGKVDVERVEINGIAVQGPALDLLIKDVVLPNFPEAKVGEWFPLEFRVERFSVTPGGVSIAIGK